MTSTTTIGGQRCPSVLLKKDDGRYYLLNPEVAEVPGVNPIVFNNLSEYADFIEWQQKEGIRCPVLYFQHESDVSGESVYRLRPDALDPQGGASTSMVPGGIMDGGGSSSTATADLDNDNLLTGGAGLSSEKIVNSKGSIIGHHIGSMFGGTGKSITPEDLSDYPSVSPILRDDLSAPPPYTTAPIIREKQPDYSKLSPTPMDPNWGGAAYTQSLIDKGDYKGNEVRIYVP